VLTTRFEYDLPKVVQSDDGQHRYTLLIQKQAGTETTQISLTVILPPDTNLLTTTPPPQVVDGNTLTFDMQAETDVVVKVIYE
jgi:hypothetical protein